MIIVLLQLLHMHIYVMQYNGVPWKMLEQEIVV